MTRWTDLKTKWISRHQNYIENSRYQIERDTKWTENPTVLYWIVSVLLSVMSVSCLMKVVPFGNTSHPGVMSSFQTQPEQPSICLLNIHIFRQYVNQHHLETGQKTLSDASQQPDIPSCTLLKVLLLFSILIHHWFKSHRGVCLGLQYVIILWTIHQIIGQEIIGHTLLLPQCSCRYRLWSSWLFWSKFSTFFCWISTESKYLITLAHL